MPTLRPVTYLEREREREVHVMMERRKTKNPMLQLVKQDSREGEDIIVGSRSLARDGAAAAQVLHSNAMDLADHCIKSIAHLFRIQKHKFQSIPPKSFRQPQFPV